MTQKQLREILSQFSISYDVRATPRRITVVVNHQIGSSMYLANSSEEVTWLSRQSESVTGGPTYTKYLLHTVD